MGEMMKNEPNRIRGIASNPTTSNQIQPNPTKKNGPARIRAQAVGSKLARTSLDLGRARWRRGGSERMNGKAKGLSDRKTTPGQGTRPTLHGQAKDLSDCNTCFIYDEGERESGLEGNLRLNSLKFAYVRLIGEKILRTPPLISDVSSFGAGFGSRGGAGECRLEPRSPQFRNRPGSRLAARIYGLNLAASCSLCRASRVRSLPTATTRQPSASQCRASASTGARMPAALPVFWMRLTASSMAARASG